MTLVSDPFGGKALIFLHQSRSAGLAVCAILQEEFGVEATFKLGGTTGEDYLPYDAFLDAAAADTHPVYMGHFFYGAHLHVPRPCVYFTMLRDPVDRLLSRYERYCTLRGERLDCARWLAGDFESHDGMVRRICGLGHMEDAPDPFDFVNDRPVPSGMATTAAHYDQAVETLDSHFSCVLMRERFVESMAELQRVLGCGPLFSLNRQVLNDGGAPTARERYPEAILRQIEDQNVYDRRLYDRYRLRFDAALASRDAAFAEEVRIMRMVAAILTEPGRPVLPSDRAYRRVGAAIEVLERRGDVADAVEILKRFAAKRYVSRDFLLGAFAFLHRQGFSADLADGIGSYRARFGDDAHIRPFIGDTPRVTALRDAEEAARRGDMETAAAVAEQGLAQQPSSEDFRGLRAGALLALGRDADATAVAEPLTEAVWRRLHATVLTPAAGTAAASEGLRGLVRFLDQLADTEHEDTIQSVIDAFAGDPEDAAARIAAASTPELAETSATFAGLRLAAEGLGGTAVPACRAEAAERLDGLAGPTRWAFRALAKLAALNGDCRQAADILERAIATRGDAMPILLERAAMLFCLGREAEARAAVSRAFASGPVDVIRRRQDEIRTWGDQLEDAMAHGLADGGPLGSIGSAAGYVEPERVRALWHAHREDCVEGRTRASVCAWTNAVMFGRVEDLLAADPDLRHVVNFGTLCGIREAALAARHAEVSWAGFDISEVATALNREHFRGSNLVFSSDLDGLLGDLAGKPGKSLLAHCRTTDVMLPEAVKTLYRRCHGHGIDAILAAEYFSVCVPTLDYPDFDADPVDTVHWDGVLMIHNYDRILPEAGYRVVSSEYRPVPLMVHDHGLQEALLIRLVLAERVGGAEGGGDA